MSKNDIFAITLILIGIPLLIFASSTSPPAKGANSYTEPAIQQQSQNGNVEHTNVLTKPRYQDVPALNRPLMLPASCYSDTGCSE